MKLPPGVRIAPINRIDRPWRWYYVDGHDNCWRVRNPIVLLALALGWRPKRRVPRAVAR